MRSRTLIVFSALAVSGLAVGCQKDDAQYKKYVDERFDQFDKKLDLVLAEVKRGGGGAAGAGRPAAPPQRPNSPDPSAVYAVPIEGSPYKGAEHAKVTIVEAFEFA